MQMGLSKDQTDRIQKLHFERSRELAKTFLAMEAQDFYALHNTTINVDIEVSTLSARILAVLQKDQLETFLDLRGNVKKGESIREYLQTLPHAEVYLKYLRHLLDN